jgi:hypothetical protein
MCSLDSPMRTIPAEQEKKAYLSGAPKVYHVADENPQSQCCAT